METLKVDTLDVSLCKKYNNGRSLNEYINRYGFLLGEKLWEERNKKQSFRFSLEYYISTYGERIGIEKYLEYIKEMNKCSLKSFVERYGQDDGYERYKNFISSLSVLLLTYAILSFPSLTVLSYRVFPRMPLKLLQRPHIASLPSESTRQDVQLPHQPPKYQRYKHHGNDSCCNLNATNFIQLPPLPSQSSPTNHLRSCPFLLFFNLLIHLQKPCIQVLQLRWRIHHRLPHLFHQFLNL